MPVQSRIMHYTLLAGLLTDVVDLNLLCNPELSEDEEVMRPVAEKADAWLSSGEDANARLKKEFARLFLLPGGVRPYESVYLGRQPILMQEPWVEVREFYASRGWQLDDSPLPEDHAAVELSFMAHLLSGDHPSEANAFFAEHVNRWIPDLFEDVYTNQHADFYQSVAEYGLAFLRADSGLDEEGGSKTHERV